MMMPLAWACWLRKTILQLLSSFGSLDGTLRSLDLDFALLPLNGSHVNLGFPSTVSNIRARLAPDHRASVPVLRGKYPLRFDAPANAVNQRELGFDALKELLVADLCIPVQVNPADERDQL
jgi:hypothetical protein